MGSRIRVAETTTGSRPRATGTTVESRIRVAETTAENRNPAVMRAQAETEKKMPVFVSRPAPLSCPHTARNIRRTT